MTVYNLNISSYPHSNMISYSDMLSNVSDQLTSKFLVIGVCIVVVALWHIFGGDKRTDRMSMEVTGALDMITLVFGMYLIALYAIVYWGVNLEVTVALNMIALVFGMYLVALYDIVYWDVNL